MQPASFVRRSSTTSRPRCTHPARCASGPPTCARPRRRVRHRCAGQHPRLRAAAAFADAALRRVLEVIDRRRPLAQLRPLLAAGLVDSLLPAGAPHRRGAAPPGCGGCGSSRSARRHGRRGGRQLHPRRAGARDRLPGRAGGDGHRAALAGGRPAHRLSATADSAAAQHLPLLGLLPRGLPALLAACHRPGRRAGRRCASPRRAVLRRADVGQRRDSSSSMPLARRAVAAWRPLGPRPRPPEIGQPLRGGDRATAGAVCGTASTWTLNRKPTDSSFSAVEHADEHVVALALVLDQRVALRHRPQADALLEVVHLVEVLAPLAVDDVEQHVALQLAHGARAGERLDLGFPLGVSLFGVGDQRLAAALRGSARRLRRPRRSRCRSWWSIPTG